MPGCRQVQEKHHHYHDCSKNSNMSTRGQDESSEAVVSGTEFERGGYPKIQQSNKE